MAYLNYDNNETISNYFSVPYIDANANDYKEILMDINSPDHDIVNVDKKYITTCRTTFTIKKGFNQYNDNSIVILNNDNKEQFRCNKKWYSDSTIIRDVNNVSILASRYTFSIITQNDDSQDSMYVNKIHERITISSGDSSDGKYGKINTMYTLNKAGMNIRRAEFENILSKKKEILEIRHYQYTPEYYVYCNVGEKNETMISKFRFHEKKYTIEVAPRVDYMYMLAICLNILIL